MTTKQTVVFKASNFSGHLSPSAKAEVNNLKGTIFYNGFEEKGAPKNDKEKDDFQDIDVRKKKKKKNHHKNMDKSLLLELNAMKMGYFELLSKSIGPMKPVKKSFYKKLCLYSHQVLEGESSLLKSEWVFYMYNKGGGAWTDLSLVKSILSPEETDEIRRKYPVKDFKGYTPSPEIGQHVQHNRLGSAMPNVSEEQWNAGKPFRIPFPYYRLDTGGWASRKMEPVNTSGSLPSTDDVITGPEVTSSAYPTVGPERRTRTRRPIATPEKARSPETATKKETPAVEDVQMEPEDKQASEVLATVNAKKNKPSDKQQEEIGKVLSAIRQGRQVGPLDGKTRALLQEGWKDGDIIRRPKMSHVPNGRKSPEKTREISDRFDMDESGRAIRQRTVRDNGADVPYKTVLEAHEGNERATGTPLPVWLGGEAPGSEVTNPDPRATALRALNFSATQKYEAERKRREPMLKRADEYDRIRAELARKYGSGTREFSMALQDAVKNMPNFEESEAPAARPARPESPVDVTGTLSGSPSFAPPSRVTGRRGVRAAGAVTPPTPTQTAPKITASKMIEEYVRLLEAGDPRTIDKDERIISAKKFWENEGRGETYKKVNLGQRQAIADSIGDYEVVDGVAVRKTKIKGWSNTMRAEQTQKGTYFAKSGPFPHRMYVEAHVENDRNGAPSTYVVERNLINVMVKSMGIPEYEVKRRLARIDKSAYSQE